MSGKTYIRLFQRARQLGYEIELHYLWLSSAAQAVARVRHRVRLGGHHVPAAAIRRRFARSLARLLDDYLPLAGRFGTAAGCPQNDSPFPPRMILSPCES